MTFDEYYLACATIIEARTILARDKEHPIPFSWTVDDARETLAAVGRRDLASRCALLVQRKNRARGSYFDGTMRRPTTVLADWFGVVQRCWLEPDAAPVPA